MLRTLFCLAVFGFMVVFGVFSVGRYVDQLYSQPGKSSLERDCVDSPEICGPQFVKR